MICVPSDMARSWPKRWLQDPGAHASGRHRRGWPDTAVGIRLIPTARVEGNSPGLILSIHLANFIRGIGADRCRTPAQRSDSFLRVVFVAKHAPLESRTKQNGSRGDGCRSSN